MPALNANEMKSQNRRRVLELISMESVSRAELARRTGLSRAGIGKIVDELLSDGLIIEGKPITGGVGRNSITVKLNPNAGLLVGIVMERGTCMAGICDFSGKVLLSEEYLPPKQQGREIPITGMLLLQILGDLTERLLSSLPEEQRGLPLLGIGIASPGPLDSEKGEILQAPNFGNWEGISITGYFSERFGVPAWLENNANAFALAERRYVIREEKCSFLELLVDHGLGGGLIFHGKLFNGCNNQGTEVGHISISLDGPRCSCGNYGCAELYAAIPNITAWAAQFDARFANWNALVDQAECRNDSAVSVLSREAEYLASLIVSAVNLYNLHSVILCGQINYKPQYLTALTEHAVRNRLMSPLQSSVRVLPSGLRGEERVLAGSNLVLENLF